MLKTAFATWPELTKGQLCSIIPDGALLMMGGGFSGNVIDDSVIFNRPDADFTEWTPAATPTSLRAGSCFFWAKLDTVDTSTADTSARHIIMAGTDRIYFGNQAVASKEYRLTVNLLGNNWYSLDDFRDFTGWSAFYVKWDVDNGTASERLRAWIADGTSIREITWENSPAITGADCDFNDTQNHHLGTRADTSGIPFSGYLGQFALIDGTGSTAITDFIEQDTNGNYGPKSDATIQALTFGNHGVFFKDGTDIQAGTDTSGNSMSITTTNGPAAGAVVSDSPTNSSDGVSGNYCVWNNLLKEGGTYAYAEGNTQATYTSSTDAGIVGTLGVSSGKYYIEFTAGSTFDHFGIASEAALQDLVYGTNTGGWTGLGGDAYTYYANSGDKRSPSSLSAYGSTFAATDIIGMAIDFDNDAIWFSKNDTWQNSATQSEIEAGTTTNAAFTGVLSGQTWFPFFHPYTNSTVVLNAGQKTFSGTAPSDFNAINSKTIADATPPDTPDYTDVFNVVLEQEGSLLATLATARSGWSSWVEIGKNRDATETWFARFSHDSSNEHFWGGSGASSNADYQAARTLSGTNEWTGFVLNGDATGVAIGSVSHTNGANTTVTHNLGNTDCCILLFDRDTAGSRPIWMYHPEFSAGDLFDITTYTAEVADSAIENVGANSFDIDTAEASGTYDYIVMTPDSGCISLSSATPNGSTDGPVIYNGLSPLYLWTVVRNSNGGFIVYDSASETYNALSNAAGLYINTAPPAVSADIDFLATGQKIRSTATALNWSSGDKIVQVVFGLPLSNTTYASGQSRAR
jgi:hypothetical protein